MIQCRICRYHAFVLGNSIWYKPQRRIGIIGNHPTNNHRLPSTIDDYQRTQSTIDKHQRQLSNQCNHCRQLIPMNTKAMPSTNDIEYQQPSTNAIQQPSTNAMPLLLFHSSQHYSVSFAFDAYITIYNIIGDGHCAVVVIV
jgi:hypothetical protein